MHKRYACLCFAFSFPLLCSPAVGKVSKPRRGHPLVEFVIVGWIGRKNKDWNRYLQNWCMNVHAYDAFKGRPREVRTVQPLFRLPRGSTPGSISERVEFPLDYRLQVKAVLLNSTLFNLSIEQN